jgi:hypothetical protein
LLGTAGFCTQIKSINVNTNNKCHYELNTSVKLISDNSVKYSEQQRAKLGTNKYNAYHHSCRFIFNLNKNLSFQRTHGKIISTDWKNCVTEKSYLFTNSEIIKF